MAHSRAREWDYLSKARTAKPPNPQQDTVTDVVTCSPFTSSMPAPGMSFIDEEFGTTSEILTSFAVSVFVLGFAVRRPAPNPILSL